MAKSTVKKETTTDVQEDVISKPEVKAKEARPEPVRTNKIPRNKFSPDASFPRQRARVTPSAKDTVEDLTRPDYWSHVANLIERDGSIIEAFWDDGSKYAEYIVLARGHTWLSLCLLYSVDIDQNIDRDGDDAAGYQIKHVNYHHKWCIIRESDNTILQTGLETREAASKWLFEYMEAVKR